MRSQRSADGAGTTYLQSQVDFYREEVLQQRATIDALLASGKVYQAQMQTLTMEGESLKATIAKLAKQLEEAKKKEDNQHMPIDDDLGDDDVFLGCNDKTAAKFVDRVQQYVAFVCMKKGNQTNWSAAELMHKVSDSTVLKKKPKLNGRNEYHIHEISKIERRAQRKIDAEEAAREGRVLEELSDISDDSDLEPAPAGTEHHEARRKGLDAAWNSKTVPKKSAFKTRWISYLAPKVQKRKREGMNKAQKLKYIADSHTSICNIVVDRCDLLWDAGRDHACTRLPKTRNPSYILATSPALETFFRQRLLKKTQATDEELMMEIVTGFRLHASVLHGRAEVAKEAVRRSKKQKPTDKVKECAQTLRATMIGLGVPEGSMNEESFDWHGLYETCAEYDIGYSGVPIEFRWRLFRERAANVFEDNYSKFLPGGSFVMFKLIPGSTGTSAEGEIINHDDVILKLKACVAAQTAFRNATGQGDVARWNIWESTREAKLLELQRAAGTPNA